MAKKKVTDGDYIKLSRQLLNNPIVMKDSDYLAVWVWLLLNAAWKEHDVLHGGKRLKLQAGQLLAGRKQISRALGVNESKVYRILKAFEIEQQIEQQTNSHGSVISIVNWNLYQANEQQNRQRVNNHRTTSEQPPNTTEEREEREEREEGEEIIYVASEPLPKNHKFTHGQYGNVKLTEAEYDRLKEEFPDLADDAIQFLDEYVERKGYKHKNSNLTIRKWVLDAVKEERAKNAAQTVQQTKKSWFDLADELDEQIPF